MVQFIKCLFGFHKWVDFEITVNRGMYIDDAGKHQFPSTQEIIDRCSVCHVVDTARVTKQDEK